MTVQEEVQRIIRWARHMAPLTRHEIDEARRIEQNGGSDHDKLQTLLEFRRKVVHLDPPRS